MEKKKVYVYVVSAALVIGGYFLYTVYQKKQVADFEMETQVDSIENKEPSQCENGEWTNFPQYNGGEDSPKYAGNVRLKGGSDDAFTSQDGQIVFVTDERYSLDFFADRDVRIEGSDIGTEDARKVYVARIKCVGSEANKDIRMQRRNLMKYIAGNMGELALEKSKGGAWQVGTFYFVNDTDVYVEYESEGSLGGESSYDARLWLIRVANMDTDIPSIETLAYIQEDEEDPDKNVVKIGQDLYKDADDMSVYELDSESGEWILQ